MYYENMNENEKRVNSLLYNCTICYLLHVRSITDVCNPVLVRLTSHIQVVNCHLNMSSFDLVLSPCIVT